MARVAIIGDAMDFQYAGIKVYLDGLTNALALYDTENEYMILRAKANFRKKAGQVYVKSGVSKYLHPKSRLFLEIPKSIKKLHPDIVIEPCHFGPYLLPDKIKKVTIIHDLTPILFPQYHPRSSGLLHKLLLPGTIKKADLVITNSYNTRKDLVNYYPFADRKTEVIYPGLKEVFNQNSKEAEYPERPYILHVGTIEPRKNISHLLAVFFQLKEHHQWPGNLVICGRKGWKTKNIYADLKKHKYKKDIQCLDFVSEEKLRTLYQHATALVFPSHYEGFGIPLLEAMSQNCPIITNNNSCQREVCGDAAVYIENYDASTWARETLRIFNDDSYRHQNKNNAQARVQKFQWQESARQMTKLIKDLQN